MFGGVLLEKRRHRSKGAPAEKCPILQTLRLVIAGMTKRRHEHQEVPMPIFRCRERLIGTARLNERLFCVTRASDCDRRAEWAVSPTSLRPVRKIVGGGADSGGSAPRQWRYGNGPGGAGVTDHNSNGTDVARYTFEKIGSPLIVTNSSLSYKLNSHQSKSTPWRFDNSPLMLGRIKKIGLVFGFRGCYFIGIGLVLVCHFPLSGISSFNVLVQCPPMVSTYAPNRGALFEQHLHLFLAFSTTLYRSKYL